MSAPWQPQQPQQPGWGGPQTPPRQPWGPQPQQPWGAPQQPWGPPQQRPWGSPQPQSWGGPQGPSTHQNPYAPPPGAAPGSFGGAPGSFGGSPYRQPARSGCGVAALVVVGIVVLVMAILGAVIVGVFSSIPTYSSTPWTPSPRAGGTTPPVTTPPVTTPPATPPATTPPRVTDITKRTQPTGITYANASYRVPAVQDPPPARPKVATLAEAETVRLQNPLYRQDLAQPVQCTNDVIAAEKMSAAQYQAALDKTIDCLMRAWAPALTAAGQTLNKPRVNVFTTKVTTPCGEGSEGEAFYCGSNQQIYIHPKHDTYYDNITKDGLRAPTAELVLAHEFGHHVGTRSGILVGSVLVRSKATSKSADLLEQRKKEIQAECMAGLGMRAIGTSMGLTKTDGEHLIGEAYHTGDDPKGSEDQRDHGTGQNNGIWFTRGFNSANVGVCNTFVAPLSEVD